MARSSDEHDGRQLLLVVVGILLVLAGLYAAGALLAGDRVPRETRVAGVDIGGLEPAQARQTLTEALGPRAAEPLQVRVGARRFTVDPSQAGLQVDVAASVERAGGRRSFAPARLYDLVFGGGDVDPVISYDADGMRAAVERIADLVEQPPKEGAITFRQGVAQLRDPRAGVALPVESAAAVIRDAFLVARGPVNLPVQRLAPEVSEDQLRTALVELAEPAVSEPVVLRFGPRSLRLLPREFAPALYTEPDGAELALRVDEQALRTGIERKLDAVERQPRDATVVIRNGRPVVVPAAVGTGASPGALGEAVLEAVSPPGRRTAPVELVPARPERSTAEVRALQIEEVVSDFVTFYPHAEYRNVNQGRAAELISGTLLAPGETFSFNDTVGKRTRANGFIRGFVIADGIFIKELGGGVSQVVTTTYNAAFFAGLEDVAHTPHSRYIDRYPAGREATVSWPDIDLKFRNNTPYGVLIEAWVVPSTPGTSGEMHVRMWSKKYWRVTTETSAPYDYTEPGVQYDDSESCVGQDGVRGFEIDVYRYLSRGGRRVDTETIHTEYLPTDAVYCAAAAAR